jgi:hypothetical protein
MARRASSPRWSRTRRLSPTIGDIGIGEPRRAFFSPARHFGGGACLHEQWRNLASMNEVEYELEGRQLSTAASIAGSLSHTMHAKPCMTLSVITWLSLTPSLITASARDQAIRGNGRRDGGSGLPHFSARSLAAVSTYDASMSERPRSAASQPPLHTQMAEPLRSLKVKAAELRVCCFCLCLCIVTARHACRSDTGPCCICWL